MDEPEERTAGAVVLESDAALADWAEHEGWLDDSVLLSTRIEGGGTARLRMGLRREVDGATERLFEFELVAEDAVALMGAGGRSTSLARSRWRLLTWPVDTA